MSDLPTLEKILQDLDIEIDSQALSLLSKLRIVLLEYNQHTNLTAIRDPVDVEVRLFADSLALMTMIEAERLREGREGMRLIDIGTGAGFPGLPLAITNQALEVTLVDATGKKVAFIEKAISKLGLRNAIAIHARSEDLAHQSTYRERYDIVVARAVASLPALVELCLPFLRVGGLALFPKGINIADEVDSAANALKTVRGELLDVETPSSSALENTSIVSVRKIRPTPKKYPRSPGTPSRQPL
jgi:16S rRNA (guanine527-N7)-methyltransferase